jgi:3-mercaptopyruvate sulfurtransferase SseA
MEVVAYCRGPYCIYSDEAVRLLQEKGFRARRLGEGFPEWRAAGYPVETENGTGSRSTPEKSKVTREDEAAKVQYS